MGLRMVMNTEMLIFQ